ncbi:SH3 domain-containing protein [Streptomyces sp. KHY 26]|uniref:SH3 domain-containing protein n=1 Tax=Streptomyces sp. KHY 26 TaxID=3097359 RepID=UPI00376ECC75
MMRTAARTVATLALAVTGATVTAGSAWAGTATAQDGAMVTAYETVNERFAPTRGSASMGTFHAGETALGLCWTHGETITDNGVTNDVWVSLGMARWEDGSLHPSFFVSAVYLKGDATGGVPNPC